MSLLHFVRIIIPFVGSQCFYVYSLLSQFQTPSGLLVFFFFFYKLVNMFCIVSCYLALNHVLPCMTNFEAY